MEAPCGTGVGMVNSRARALWFKPGKKNLRYTLAIKRLQKGIKSSDKYSGCGGTV